MRYKGIPIDSISLFNTPRIYLQLTLKLSISLLSYLGRLIVANLLYFLAGILLFMMIIYLPPLKTLDQIIGFVLYWVILGVASSIGLGTGLHTFVLYLGPHIAKIALTATICGKIPEMIPSKWEFQRLGQCINPENEQIGFFGILMAVQLESFLWGFGTALGELPPYFVAKKAAETRSQLKKMKMQAQKQSSQQQRPIQHAVQQSQRLVPSFEPTPQTSDTLPELQQIQQLQNKVNPTLLEQAKLWIYSHLQQYGFWTILVCASIPNPLFDLAGITSGHFRIPFKTFFSATVIGKAVIKVHLQMIFVIAIFRKSTLDALLWLIECVSKSLAESFSRKLQTQKKQLNQPTAQHDDTSFLAGLWDLFITGMVLYFLKSILDAYVKEKAIELRDN